MASAKKKTEPTKPAKFANFTAAGIQAFKQQQLIIDYLRNNPILNEPTSKIIDSIRRNKLIEIEKNDLHALLDAAGLNYYDKEYSVDQLKAKIKQLERDNKFLKSDLAAKSQEVEALTAINAKLKQMHQPPNPWFQPPTPCWPLRQY